jgi:UDPglucose 6-dehydrogenase
MRKSQTRSKTSVSIIGSGIVGSAVGKGLAELGNEVLFYDIDTKRTKELKSSGFNISGSVDAAISGSQISFICVPTPTIRGTIELDYVRSAAKQVARALAKKDDYHVVVIKSTVLPTTSEDVIIPILEKHTKKKAGESFGVCFNPEFLTEIHHSWSKDKSFVRSFYNEPFIVIGSSDKKSGDALENIYQPLKNQVIRTNLRTAEMIKYAFNCALTCKISYWNEIYFICRKIDVDSEIVASTAGMDDRIGKYGTIHGKAFGGKCLPKDLRAFIHYCRKLGYNPHLLKAIEEINVRIARENGVRE